MNPVLLPTAEKDAADTETFKLRKEKFVAELRAHLLSRSQLREERDRITSVVPKSRSATQKRKRHSTQSGVPFPTYQTTNQNAN